MSQRILKCISTKHLTLQKYEIEEAPKRQISAKKMEHMVTSRQITAFLERS